MSPGAGPDDPGNGLFDLDAPLLAELTAALAVGTAVDVGCGTGRVTAGLVGQGHRVVGVDASMAMLQRARRRLPGTTFVEGEMQRLPLSTDSVDLVLTALALTHVPDLAAVFIEFARVLRPGGHLVISDVHHELVLLGSMVTNLSPTGQPLMATARRHTDGDFPRAALSTGFEVRRFEERPHTGRAETEPLPEPTREIGTWQEWPWSLLGLIPGATRAAWEIPAVVVWHFQLAVAGAD